VVTVAMLPEMAEAFVAEWGNEPTPWFDLLREGLPLSPETKIVGFEVVGAEVPSTFIRGTATDTPAACTRPWVSSC
jgi:hypothetical protein